MRHAFVDESGNEALFSSDQFLVVALLATDRLHDIELVVKHARKRFGTNQPTGEMKAHKAPSKVVTNLLGAISHAPVEIMATVVDKGCILRPPSDRGLIYRVAVARTVRRAAERHLLLDVCLDKRYTTEYLRRVLEEQIYEELAEVPGAAVTVRHQKSEVTPGLQTVDFVAWSFFQKYSRNDSSYYQIIEGKIVHEEVIKQPLW